MWSMHSISMWEMAGSAGSQAPLQTPKPESTFH